MFSRHNFLIFPQGISRKGHLHICCILNSTACLASWNILFFISSNSLQPNTFTVYILSSRSTKSKRTWADTKTLTFRRRVARYQEWCPWSIQPYTSRFCPKLNLMKDKTPVLGLDIVERQVWLIYLLILMDELKII